MSIGVGVSDFIKALELAHEIRTRFVDAPEQFKAISDEVRSLSIVLDDIKVVLPQRDLTSEQRKELAGIIVGCSNVLDTLNKTLEDYKELDSDVRDKGFRFKVRKGWKRLRWEPEDVRELRSRITSNTSLLNAFNGQLTRQVALQIQDGVDRLHERQDHRERHEGYQAILDWLTPIDYAVQQSDFISRRQEGTGQWLLDSDEFQNWVDQSNRTLFCPGIPGAGKTMSASIVIDKLYAKFRNNVNVGIAYIYCNFRRQQEQKPADLLANLLKQLIQGLYSVPQSIQTLYKHHQHQRTRPLLDEILQALHSVISDYSKVFIITDALDECQASDGGRKRLLTEFFSLQAKTAINLFATSRFIPEIVNEFEGRSTQLEIRASKEDLQKYLDGHILRLPSFVSRSADLQKEVKNAIIKAVDGMFLLAQLHLDSLIGKRSPKAIRVALETLPKGSKAYDQAYREAMERIEGQIADFRDLAKQVLSWITCAKRPLTTLELRHALAVETGEFKLDKENLPEIEDIVSVCAGLVTVDEESDIIRLVHYTTQEYFERIWTSVFPNAQRDIANSCVTYLSFNDFKAGFCLTDKEFEERLELNSFYEYAARNWGHHVNAASTNVQRLIPEFLKNGAKASSSCQAMIVSNEYRYSNYSQDVPKQVTGIHLAAYFGLRETIIALLEKEYRPDIKDSDGRTPLWWAVASGHEAVVRLLVERADVEADSKDSHGRTPLSRAAESGHEAVIRPLVERADVEADSKDSDSRTPLWWAAANGYEAVVRLLVERADVEAVVRLLVERVDVEADSKDSHGWTPLLWAAENGHEAVVRLLVERADVEADSKDSHGWTPLSRAAANGQEAVVRLLVERADVEADSKDSHGWTPLLWAAENGYEAVVRLLMERADVEADSKDSNGWTPLSRAAANGHEAVVRLLQSKTGLSL